MTDDKKTQLPVKTNTANNMLAGYSYQFVTHINSSSINIRSQQTKSMNIIQVTCFNNRKAYPSLLR